MHSLSKMSIMLKTTVYLFFISSLCFTLAVAGADEAAFIAGSELESMVTQQTGSTLKEEAPRTGIGRQLKTVSRRQSLQGAVQPVDRAGKMLAGMKDSGRSTGALKNLLTGAQRENLDRLSAGGQVARVSFNRVNGTPAVVKTRTFLTGDRKSGRALSRATETAQTFLNDNKALLKLKDPDKELVLKQAWSDDLGASHYRYQQIVNDVPVYGKQLLVHLDGSDKVYMFNGRYEPSPEQFRTVPEITQKQALNAALLHMGRAGATITADSSDLVIYTRPDGQMVLSYVLVISAGLSESWTYFIDALTGEFVHRISNIQYELVSASGSDLNLVSQSFNAWHASGTYYLVDPSFPSAAMPSDPVSSVQSPGNTYILTANNGDGENLYHITSSSTSSGWDRAGVSVMANTKTTYDYYKGTFDRNGIDDNEKNYMAVVHLGNNYANAFWNGTFIVFGDGDGVTFSNLAASLDITAHEIQHGITQSTADLKYENQSGALNEAYSDLFACMIDDDDWTVGEDCTISSPGYLRNLADPSLGLSSLPATMSDYRNLPNTEDGDWGGVHINMSIITRAGYLMAQGLDVEGGGTSIGRAKTAEIWYRALTTYLTAYSQFSDARSAMIQAAEDLYGAGSPEVAAVQAAYDTVEIFGSGGVPPDPDEPTPGDEVSGDDINIYLYSADGEHYNLYALVNAGAGYAVANDKGPLNDTGDNINRPNYTKAAAYTDAVGDTIIFYATEDFDLHRVWLFADGTYGSSSEVLDTKDFYSTAISPDGRYFVYTTPFSDDNHIYVLDLDESKEGVIALIPPTDIEGENDVFNTILYADSLAFDFTGKTVVFDALNCISTPDSSCIDGDGFRYWSIGLIYLENDPDDVAKVKGTLAFPFPNQDPDYDIAYPAFAANNNYVLAVDVVDYSAYPMVSSMVWTLNGKDGENKQVASPYGGSGDDPGMYGVPTFWGGDDAVTIQRLSDTNTSTYRVPMDNNWAGPADSSFQGSSSAITSLNDYAAAMPIMHRQAERSVSGEITFSTQNITFSNIAVGSQSTQDLTLTNTSGKDIRIQNIAMSGSAVFYHNGTNGLLSRNGQMVITLIYAPSASGPHSGTLTFTSDADRPTSQISLSGTTDAGSSGGGGGGGGGCFLNTLSDTLLE